MTGDSIVKSFGFSACMAMMCADSAKLEVIRRFGFVARSAGVTHLIAAV